MAEMKPDIGKIDYASISKPKASVLKSTRVD